MFMKKFPGEFSDFIQKAHIKRSSPGSLGINGENVRWFPNIIDAGSSRAAIQLLHKELSPYLRPQHFPISPDLIKKLRRNFTETLPKTFRNETVSLNSTRSGASMVAKKIGLLQMLGSKSLHALAQEISGYELEARPGFQVSRYKPGNFIGPHNDHHPEDKHLRDGYIDFQVTLTSQAVANQYLIYENNGVLNNIVDMSIPSGLAIAHLPFWHQVTPLIAKKGRETEAERWLIMVSFNKAEPPKKSSNTS